MERYRKKGKPGMLSNAQIRYQLKKLKDYLAVACCGCFVNRQRIRADQAALTCRLCGSNKSERSV